MRTALAAAVLIAATGCGAEEPPPKKTPVAAAPAAPALKSDPNGKFTCIKCGIRTNSSNCPGCKSLLATPADPAAAPVAPVPKKTGEVSKTSVAARFACPKPGCDFKDARKGTCLKHGDTQMIEEHFVCMACSVKETSEGKCSKCGAALKSSVK